MNSPDLAFLKKECAPAEILAVSKLQSLEKIKDLYLQGQRKFAENYVQEALNKIESLQEFTDIEWHFIGSLQKNKIKKVLGRFNLIHSIDSFELAEALGKQCQLQQKSQNILLQVNIANEESKHGFNRESLLNSWSRLEKIPGLNILGLMTMPPLTEDPHEVRPYFKDLSLLKNQLLQLKTEERHTLDHLSMGTSHDFRVAVAEGSSLVRLGTILFGERPSRG